METKKSSSTKSLKVKNFFSSELGFGVYKPLANKLLKETVNILNEFNISYFLISGTLLGYVRHNDYIPWDDDIDLMLEKKSYFSNIFKIVEKYGNNLTFILKDNYVGKICFKNEGIQINKNYWDKDSLQKGRKLMFPFIDLFFYTEEDECKNIEFYHKKWKVEEFFPLQKVIFNEIENITIPKNPHYFLERNYGKDCMEIAKSSCWNHKKDEVIKNTHEIELKHLLNHVCK